MSMTGDAVAAPRTIWAEFEDWAADFKPWQRFVLCTSVRSGVLTEEQVGRAYAQFLHDHELAEAPDPPLEIPAAIAGRPATSARNAAHLRGLSNLRGVNALPGEAALTFSPGLTVIYGGNGVGKSGFARILSRGCFCRNKPTIHPNIYAEGVAPALGATVTLRDADGVEAHIELVDDVEIPELKRMSLFDTAEARTYLTEQNPLGFKPVGFDVFPEMARVYAKLTEKLDAEIQPRSRANNFPNSFIAPESEVSRFVANLGARTDLIALRALAVFGEAQEARLVEISRQIAELQNQSPATALVGLVAAKTDIEMTKAKFAEGLAHFDPTSRAAHLALIADLKVKLATAVATGAESFKRSFFKAVGTPEWEEFLKAAQDLGHHEDEAYPVAGDHCLLCHRPLNDEAHALIHRFWEFLASDVQRDATAARTAVEEAAEALEAIDWNFFAPETTARVHISRLRPDLAGRLATGIAAAAAHGVATVAMLRANGDEIAAPVWEDLTGPLDELLQQVDADIVRLQSGNADAAIAALEVERVLLRHRQVLSQLLAEIETFVADQKWALEASGAPKRALNTRALTQKEGEMFATVLAEDYRGRLSRECEALDCALPVEMRTQGQRGQTVRSLRMKDDYGPEEILSEGEQRAVALADFLTEVGLNPAATGIILDDPVNSQDHRRKHRIATRLVTEAETRQVIVFTHDMVFLTRLVELAESKVALETHWVERDSSGAPGQVTLNDSPADSPQYRNTEKAKLTLAEAKAKTGLVRHQLVQRGMGELRRTLEEIVPHFLFKSVVRRWTDRVMVTALTKVAWDQQLATGIVKTYEDISAFIEGHTHPEESMGAPAEPSELENMIGRVADIIRRAKPDRK